MAMVKSVKKTVLRHNMFNGVDSVTVALSGGADSVALLSVMLELQQEFGFKVYAAHLNHCLRGEESDRDEAFVRSLCEKLNVTLFCEKADVSGFAKREGLSIELAARKVRYAFLERVGVGVIATAHTASDNIETFLHNAVRGSGLQGLCAIPPVRGRFIRPLLGVTRAEVEQYCKENRLDYCIDSTNIDEQYTRNFIRHSVVPKLQEVNSAAVKNVSALSDTLRDDADYLKAAADKALSSALTEKGLSVNEVKTLHPAIKSRVIAEFYEREVGICPERIHINAVLELIDEGRGRASVQRDFAAEIRKDVLKFVKLKSDRELPSVEVTEFPFVYENTEIRCLTAESFKNQVKFNNLLLNCAVDCDKICDKLILRGRRPGDKIALRGRNCTKTFKNLFNEAGLSQAQRNSLAVAADSEGVIWLQDFGVDRRVAVSESTEKVLVFEPKVR